MLLSRQDLTPIISCGRNPHLAATGLAANKIPIAALTGAQLAAKLSFSIVPWNETTREIFYLGGKAVRTEKMNRCVVECDSNIPTDEADYRSKLIEVQEWPLGWPFNTSPTSGQSRNRKVTSYRSLGRFHGLTGDLFEVKSFLAGVASAEENRYQDHEGADFYENLSPVEPVDGGAF